MSVKKTVVAIAFLSATSGIIAACKKNNVEELAVTATLPTAKVSSVTETFGSNIDLNSLENYTAQAVPNYITKDNCPPANPVTDKGATLGRVLFYDKKLSATGTIACASCHKQELAFGDNLVQSQGANGVTARHSMRLVNARFTAERRFFWDKRAATLEFQTTQPIQNHEEMGFSGLNGDPGISVLISRLQAVKYYKELFAFVYGDSAVTETRIQNALAQFIRSIQSFDSKFDAGMALANNQAADFPNFTAQENLGKSLFLRGPSPAGVVAAGAGCNTCHRGPEFDIDPNSRNNGIIGVAGSTTLFDLVSTNAPSLRNLTRITGDANGPFMHNGSLAGLLDVIDHYDRIPQNAANTNLDPRLNPGGRPQSLNLSAAQKNAIVAFLATLSGKDVYTDKKWSDPFMK